MDRQEFEATVRETFESVERAMDALALEGVEVYPTDAGLRLMFTDGSEMQLVRNDVTQQVELASNSERVVFYYDSAEEHWFAQGSERPLLDELSAELSRRLSRRVQLADMI